MKELYRVIDRLGDGRDLELITVIGGAYAGEEILVSGNEVLWSSSKDPAACMDQTDERNLFRERLARQTDLVVCGCGYVGLAVIKLGKFLGWHVTALDDREEFTLRADAAGADEVFTGSMAGSLEGLSPGPERCYVVVTRDHEHDRECLGVILKRPFGYAGMMGSHTRAAGMRKHFEDCGFDTRTVSRVHTPVGLPIGADNPEEIAVSVIAQIISERRRACTGSVIPEDLRASLRALCESDERAALAIVTARRGSAPRYPGARMLIYPDGRTSGTIGGGLMEEKVRAQAVRSLKDPSSFIPHIITVDLNGQDGGAAQMICGGEAEIFLEHL